MANTDAPGRRPRWPWRVTGSRLEGFRVFDNTGDTVLGVYAERVEASRVAALFNKAYLHYQPYWYRSAFHW